MNPYIKSRIKFLYNNPCKRNIVPEYFPSKLNAADRYLAESKSETERTTIPTASTPSNVKGLIQRTAKNITHIKPDSTIRFRLSFQLINLLNILFSAK